MDSIHDDTEILLDTLILDCLILRSIIENRLVYYIPVYTKTNVKVRVYKYVNTTVTSRKLKRQVGPTDRGGSNYSIILYRSTYWPDLIFNKSETYV